jgi:hypothetical protein
VPKQFDVVISRFGTMFFADPVAAFSNIACAARPEARLVMMVWQSHDRNEWAVAIDAALSPAQRAMIPASWFSSARCAGLVRGRGLRPACRHGRRRRDPDPGTAGQARRGPTAGAQFCVNRRRGYVHFRPQRQEKNARQR